MGSVKLVRLFILLGYLLSPTAFAEIAPICGTVNVESLTGDQASRLVFNLDLGANRSLARSQCGLPREKFEVCSACTDGNTDEIMRHLRPILADGQHLSWHLNWHSIRAKSDLTEDQFKAYQSEGWMPQGSSFNSFVQDHLVGGEKSGEDFFYMHRLMIKMVQLELAQLGIPCIAPWQQLPGSIHDAIWPVPREKMSTEEMRQKQLELDQLQRQTQRFRNQRFLARLSLNELGRNLEMSLHLQLHNFYRSFPLCSPAAQAQGYCDDLLPNDTSPLNAYFWKIHGLIDQILGDWLDAHGKVEIARECKGRSSCYQWQDPWIGKYPYTQ